MTEDEQIDQIVNFAQQERLFELQRQMQMQNQMQAENIFAAVDNALTENIQLKKQLAVKGIKDQKTNIINSARTQPPNLDQQRTGKKRGGSVKSKRRK